jgi:hypothetical protein
MTDYQDACGAIITIYSNEQGKRHASHTKNWASAIQLEYEQGSILN